MEPTELEKTTNSSVASQPTTPPDYGEFCRFLAKIIIQIINGELKDPTQRAWYFAMPSDLGEFALIALTNKYPWSYVKDIVTKHIDQNLRMAPPITYAELQKLYPCEVVSDDGILHEYCDKVLTDNPKSIVDYKKGKVNAINHLKGQVMRLSKGKADIVKIETILKSKMI